MNNIFQANSIAGIELRNRIIRSATHEGMGDVEGFPSKELTDLYVRLAKGGIGAIITGYAGVQQNGKPLGNMSMINDDRHIEAFSNITREVQKYNVPIIMQIAHGGGKSDPSVTGEDIVAPSSMRYPLSPVIARELRSDEIREIIECFINSIERAKKAGFNGVELHAAHGYLLSQFLSPLMNKRKDMWGGNSENRFRIILEIMTGARKKVGSYPILMKYSAYDGDKNGVRIEEGIRIAQMFESAGGDAVEISCGGMKDGSYPMRYNKVPSEAIVGLMQSFKDMSPLKKRIIRMMANVTMKAPAPVHNYNVEAAKAIKKHVNIPVIVAGGIRKMDDIERIISDGMADYVSLSRPLIIEPNLVKKFQEGKQRESHCIDCGYCLFGAISNPLKCYHGKIN